MPRDPRPTGCATVLVAACVAFGCSGAAAGQDADAAAPSKPITKKATRSSGHGVEHSGEDGGTKHGLASFYAKRLSGRRTASGDRYDPDAMTAAHRTLPLGTQLEVVNPKTDRSVVVTVNDRGPVGKGRMVDLSGAAASELGMTKAGVTPVQARVVGKTDPDKP